MPKRAYVMNFSGVVNPAANVPFLQLVPATSAAIEITEVGIFQQTAAAASAMAGFYWARTSTASTGGTAAVAAKDGTAQTALTGTIAPLSELDPLTTVQLGAALTCTSAGASVMTRGTLAAPLGMLGCNLASGYFGSPIPDNVLGVKAGGFICLQSFATLTVTLFGYVVWHELVG